MMDCSEEFHKQLLEEFGDKAQDFLHRLQFAEVVTLLLPSISAKGVLLIREKRAILFEEGKFQRFIDIEERGIQLVLAKTPKKSRQKFKQYYKRKYGNNDTTRR